ncbi:phosphonoacetaldehyde hydrolase [Blastopirellula sp. JC732]|uniref:phosphonoacetaldehyde hydrolase n=1 Tax=Blastopirellula sediminis TaxID=2894196 RepID=A0A9X1MIC9_9BACT|nr:phosphonoacetaldehyde hydrolase [Blastopirellula sediminis]MCC9607886.1 phosphonoacetaldehyde hydrolase [Blastopirellula sediminis]MCC9627321.1 phosphonoacetaldehyde hydrolase [Blastopirellula sediminis]
MSGNELRVKAVVFDWAGTVIDFGCCAPASVFRRVFEQKGLEITARQAREPMGLAKRAHIAAVLAMPEVYQAWTDKFGEVPTDAEVDALYREFLPLQKQVLSDHCDLIPGVAELVEKLRSRQIAVGGTTGYTRELMSVVTPAAAEQGYAPDAEICSDEVREGRPAPWMIFEIAQRTNVYPMSCVVKVDDTPVGIAAGHAAGTWTVAVTDTGNEMGLTLAEYDALSEAEKEERRTAIVARFESVKPHFFVRSVTELPDVLTKINAKLAAGERP